MVKKVLVKLLKKRNYDFLYNILKPYPREVINRPVEYKNYRKLSKIIDELKIYDYKKIVVVASGPTSNNLVIEKNVLYFTTNSAIKLVENSNFIYVVNDNYYLVKYLKSFKQTDSWKGTIFWYASTKTKLEEYGVKLLNKYIRNKSRSQKEYLITNLKDEFSLYDVYDELLHHVKINLGINFYGINSGFVTLFLAYVISSKCDKNLENYGLDMGENGGGYFNKKMEVGKSIKGENNKIIVGYFLDMLYSEKKEKVKNFSYFKTKL